MGKIGQGHLKAFIRQGAKELAQALPALPQSIKTVEEPGLVGNTTQQEVGKQMGLDEYQKSLENYAARAQPEAGNEMEMER